LSTGPRILTVAICIAVGSVVGVRQPVTLGNKAVVATGLALSASPSRRTSLTTYIMTCFRA
jgi:hypothetical protein